MGTLVERSRILRLISAHDHTIGHCAARDPGARRNGRGGSLIASDLPIVGIGNLVVLMIKLAKSAAGRGTGRCQASHHAAGASLRRLPAPRARLDLLRGVGPDFSRIEPCTLELRAVLLELPGRKGRDFPADGGHSVTRIGMIAEELWPRAPPSASSLRKKSAM